MLESALYQVLRHLSEEGFLLTPLGDSGPFTYGVRWRRCLVVFANELDPGAEQIHHWVKVWSAQQVDGVQQILVAGFGTARQETGYVALDLQARTVTGPLPRSKLPRGLKHGLRKALGKVDPSLPPDFPALERMRADTEVALDRLRARKPWVTYATIAACAAMYTLTMATGGPDDSWTLFRWGADYPYTEHAGQIWRWGSAMFLHLSPLHIGLNMYSLYLVGRTLERILGARQFAGLYAASGLAGGWVSLLTSSPDLSAGASGALFGLFGAGLWMELRGHPDLPGPLRKGLVGGMGPVILANLAIGFSMSFINNAAHLGGLLGGLLCMASRLRGAPAALLGLVPALCLAGALTQGVRYPTPASYPTQRVSGGWAIPAFLAYRNVDGRPVWVGLRFAWSQKTWTQPTPLDLEAYLRKQPFQPTSHEVTPTGWLVVRLDFPPHGVAWVGVRAQDGQGKMPRVDTVLEDTEEGKAILLRCLEGQ